MLNERGKFGAEIFPHYTDIVIFVLGILTSSASDAGVVMLADAAEAVDEVDALTAVSTRVWRTLINLCNNKSSIDSQ